ncbi:alpha/beta hydrolase [Roseomonas terrae]|uniref:Alpha/beta hydrolase n=1 Tax=Neoroseomonas terrae TaxID=424799 RepID=A0ABS5EKL8_9PROT|nr:alpha/beta fold hydrolase [Neoroseomonas terrae]MBR0651515.1 alpha/beta hydrolase [Neoroseomonas terrae]
MLTILALLAALPMLLGCMLWLGQERLIFLPDARPIAAPPGWEKASLRSADGTDLALLVARGPPGRPVVLHFHGNGGNAEDRADLGNALKNAGLSIVLGEYRGYAGNPGQPGEAAFAADAAAMLAWVRQSFPGARLLLWGESLGTAVVTRLAAGQDDVAGIILESPFTSVADLAAATYPWLPTGLLLRHRFENLPRMPAIAAPVLVVASAGDRLTPPDHARRLAEAAPDARLIILPGAAHPAILNDPTGAGLRAAMEFLARFE